MEKTPCAKCGSCTSICPIYKVTGRESLTARGRLHLLEKLETKAPSKEYIDIFSRCLLCNACKTSCPRGIDLPSMVIEARSNFPTLSGEGSFKKHLAKKILENNTLLKRTASLLNIPKSILESLPISSGLRLKMGILAESAAVKPFDPELSALENGKTSRIKIFRGCLATHIYPEITSTTREVLSEKPGYVFTPPDQHCCGLASYSSGDLDSARELAKRNIELFGDDESLIISPCASCFSHLATYPELLQDEPGWYEKAQKFADRLIELSKYLSTKHRIYPPPVTQEKTRVLYHDPCHLRFRPGNYIDPPREILSSLPNIDLVELPRGSRCCGLGGLFNLAHPELSGDIGLHLINELNELRPDVIVSSCSGCLLQLKFLIAGKKGLDIKVKHLGEFICRLIPQE